jgi:hypothetical protein
MSEEGDDARARKERADALRRARDERNARIESEADGEDAVVEESPAEDEGKAEDGEPNYVDLIDQRMRRDRQPDE